MAEKKMTRVEALELAVDVINDYYGGDCEAIEVINKMIVSLTKPRKKSTAPSKASIENAALAVELVKTLRECGEESVTAKWVSEHVRGILSTQKATQVLKVAIANGDIVRMLDEKGKPHFELA